MAVVLHRTILLPVVQAQVQALVVVVVVVVWTLLLLEAG